MEDITEIEKKKLKLFSQNSPRNTHQAHPSPSDQRPHSHAAPPPAPYLVRARLRLVLEPGGYGEGRRQVVVEDRLGDDGAGGVAVELVDQVPFMAFVRVQAGGPILPCTRRRQELDAGGAGACRRAGRDEKMGEEGGDNDGKKEEDVGTKERKKEGKTERRKKGRKTKEKEEKVGTKKRKTRRKRGE